MVIFRQMKGNLRRTKAILRRAKGLSSREMASARREMGISLREMGISRAGNHNILGASPDEGPGHCVFTQQLKVLALIPTLQLWNERNRASERGKSPPRLLAPALVRHSHNTFHLGEPFALGRRPVLLEERLRPMHSTPLLRESFPSFPLDPTIRIFQS